MDNEKGYIVRHDIGHKDRDRLIFTGTLRQCRICLTAMMSVAPRCEIRGDSFDCDSPDGFRIRFEIRDKPPQRFDNETKKYL